MTLLRSKLRLGCLSLLVCAGGLEIGLRLAGFILPPARLPIQIWNSEEDKLLSSDEGLHEASPRQLWAPRPGAMIPWGVDEAVNQRGYRGPELAVEKTPGVLRIATLGDSSTFGMGVPWPATFSAELQKELARRGVQAEVLDAGVVGFTIEQGLERYLELVRPHRPDVVVLAFGAVNDHLSTVDMEDREKILENERRTTGLGSVLHVLRSNVRLLQLADWMGERLRKVDREKLALDMIEERNRLRALAKKFGQVDYQGMRRVSLRRFEELTRRLIDLARADGTQTILISMPRALEKEQISPVLVEYNRAVELIGSECADGVLDARGKVQSELARGEIWSNFFVDDYHPNERGHALIAMGLADLIQGLPPNDSE